jgi:Tol biopolymer transport system component
MKDPNNGVMTYGNYVYPMGYPITEPYWVTAKVGGVQRNVLVQLFERRVLTFTPNNPAGWQVEMGNVGRAYAAWALGRPSDGQPAWSPDGQRILFISTRDANADLFTINADGSNLQRLTQSPTWEYNAAWLPGGTQIIYDSIYPSGTHIINTDGTGSFPWIYGDSSWTADGNWFAAASFDSANHPTVIVRNGPNAVQEIYVGASGYTGRPLWSPDGTKIAFPLFSGDSSTGNSLYVINVDGSNLTQLTTAYSGNINTPSFSWAPDSTRIAFTTGQNFSTSLDVVNADGTGLQQIANLDGSDGQVAWSPTSSAIYFTRGPVASETLWSINPDGSQLQQIPTPGTNPIYYFALSPTGDRLSYTQRSDSGGIDLWVINSDGSNARLLDSPPGW